MLSQFGPIAVRVLRLSLILCGLLIVSPRAAEAARETCFDWSEAAGIVKRERLTTASRVLRRAAAVYGGQLKKITLCRSGTQYVYRMVIFEAAGRIRSLTIDARQPFPPQ